MKRIIALLLCLLMAFSFAACDNDKGDDGKKNDDTNGGTQSKVSFSVVYKGTSEIKITLGADAKPILEALPEAKSKSSAGSCGAQGTVYKYVYDNFELFVLENESSSTVDEITLKNDLIKTAEGVGIGSSKDDVIKACGNGYAKCDDTVIRYTSGSKNLQFSIKDGVVTGVLCKVYSETGGSN